MMKTVLRKTCLAFLCFLICLGLLFSMALSCVYNKAHMTAAFENYAQETREDIKMSDYATIASEIISYLSSGKEENIPMLRDEMLFSEKENVHLADCSRLTRGMGYFRYGAIAAVAVLFLWTLAVKDQDKKKQRVDEVFRAFCIGSGALCLIGIVLLVWGMVDFEGLFLVFHQVSFNNDLWLLDPDQDLLIQLMPTEFFVDYAKYILKSIAPVALIFVAAPIADTVIRIKGRKANGQNDVH